MLALFAAAVGLGILMGHLKETDRRNEESRNAGQETKQRLKWHWAAVGKCQGQGLHAVMGFNDEVICLDPGAWAWVYNGKGPP